MGRTQKRYSAEFKQQAVAIVENGRPPKEVARDLEIELSCLYAWVRQARSEEEPRLTQAARFGSAKLPAEGEESPADELRRLRREIAKLKSENLILKKAAILLDAETQETPSPRKPGKSS